MAHYYDAVIVTVSFVFRRCSFLVLLFGFPGAMKRLRDGSSAASSSGSAVAEVALAVSDPELDVTAVELRRRHQEHVSVERQIAAVELPLRLRSQVDRLVLWREKLVNALAGRRFHLLRLLLIEMKRIMIGVAMHPDVLAVTGVGVLLNDGGLWSLAESPQVSKLAADILAQWRMECHGQRRLTSCQVLWPLGHQKALSFMDAVAVFRSAAVLVNAAVAPRMVELAARACALRGFSRSLDLFVVAEDEIVTWVREPAAKALLVQLVRYANDEDARRRVVLREPAPPLAPWWSDARPCSAWRLAEVLTPAEVERAEAHWRHLAAAAGAEGLSSSLAPRAAIDLLKKARESEGHEAAEILATRARWLNLSSRKSSLPQVRSGLRAWHRCAGYLLDYAEDETLPPKTPIDVESFVALFKHRGTVSNYNYMGYIKWACKFVGLDHDRWWSEGVHLAIVGVRKVMFSQVAGHLSETFLMDDRKLSDLVVALRGLDDISALLELCVVGYQFLLRMQSEAFELQ